MAPLQVLLVLAALASQQMNGEAASSDDCMYLQQSNSNSTTCHDDCISCFGPSPDQCFLCKDPDNSVMFEINCENASENATWNCSSTSEDTSRTILGLDVITFTIVVAVAGFLFLWFLIILMTCCCCCFNKRRRKRKNMVVTAELGQNDQDSLDPSHLNSFTYKDQSVNTSNIQMAVLDGATSFSGNDLTAAPPPSSLAMSFLNPNSSPIVRSNSSIEIREAAMNESTQNQEGLREPTITISRSCQHIMEVSEDLYTEPILHPPSSIEKKLPFISSGDHTELEDTYGNQETIDQHKQLSDKAMKKYQSLKLATMNEPGSSYESIKGYLLGVGSDTIDNEDEEEDDEEIGYYNYVPDLKNEDNYVYMKSGSDSKKEPSQNQDKNVSSSSIQYVNFSKKQHQQKDLQEQVVYDNPSTDASGTDGGGLAAALSEGGEAAYANTDEDIYTAMA